MALWKKKQLEGSLKIIEDDGDPKKPNLALTRERRLALKAGNRKRQCDLICPTKIFLRKPSTYGENQALGPYNN